MQLAGEETIVCNRTLPLQTHN